MSGSTFDEYLQAAWKAQREHPEWRAGQAYFNVLYDTRRELSDYLRGTHLDPFNLNERISDFLEWVLNHWDSGPNEWVGGDHD